VAIDLNQLRRQYSEMTDDALLEIERDELVEEAQRCLDDELLQRGIRPEKRRPGTISVQDTATDDAPPEWLPDAVTVVSMVGGEPSVTDAQRVLVAARIPSFIVDREADRDQPMRSDLVVPPGQHLQATSVLDRDFFNPQSEAEWKNHFETLTDQELLDIDADLLVAGMRDRVERLVRAYEDELLKRGLAELETS
jgi:hypothetical protein